MSRRPSQCFGKPTTDPPDPPAPPPKPDADPQHTSGCAALAITNGLLLETMKFMHQNGKLLVKHGERLDATKKRLDAIDSGCQTMLSRHTERLNAQRREINSHDKRLDALEQGRQTGMSAPLGTGDAEEVETCLDEKIKCPHCGNVETLAGYDVGGADEGCIFCTQCHEVVSLDKTGETRGRGEAGEAMGQPERPPDVVDVPPEDLPAPSAESCLASDDTPSPPLEPIGQAWVYRSDGETFWGTLVGGGGTGARQACLTLTACVFHPAAPPPGRPVLVNLVPVEPRKEPSA